MMYIYCHELDCTIWQNKEQNEDILNVHNIVFHSPTGCRSPSMPGLNAEEPSKVSSEPMYGIETLGLITPVICIHGGGEGGLSQYKCYDTTFHNGCLKCGSF